MAAISLSSCVSEFIGTFLLVFTVGCNVLGANSVWGGVSIACVLMVSIYALGNASGANFNPAVSFALGLAGKMEGDWSQVFAYSCVQIVGGLCASGCYSLLYGKSFTLAPAQGFRWLDAAICETLYTAMLCFVVLNTAASKKLGGKNQFYGLAIGFVIVAGAFGAGAVSGGCFNPAVAIGIDASSSWCLVYAVFEIVGAVLAVGCFYAVRPEERSDADPPREPSLYSKLVAEFLGTFMLVLTVGLNVLGKSKAGAFSIAASLTCMIYALGDVSGAHFNPAVTVAITLRGKLDHADATKYIATQLTAGILAALVYISVHHGTAFALGPGKHSSWGDVAAAEFVFTFVLCFVVLCVATVRTAPAAELTGFIIGSCVTVGGYAIGAVSGGSLNPAVSCGIAIASRLKGGVFDGAYVYWFVELFAGVVAAAVFQAVFPSEMGVEAVPLKGEAGVAPQRGEPQETKAVANAEAEANSEPEKEHEVP